MRRQAKLDVAKRTESQLREALKARSPDYLCTVCSRFFPTQDALENHRIYSQRHNWCLRCNRDFVSPAARDEHLQKSQNHWICDIHNVDFPAKDDLTEHYRNSHNTYCDRCARYFVSAAAREEHYQHSRSHWICETHKIDFPVEGDLTEHYRNSHNTYCDRCARYFVSAAAREEHYHHSRSHWICEAHEIDYSTCEELDQHYESDPNHYWCSSCSKDYDTSEQLKNHLLTHLPRNIDCWGCSKQFARYSPLLVHLETDTCITTRLQLDRLAIQCEFSNDYVIPDCEGYLRGGERQMHYARPIFLSHPKRFGCSKCDRFSDQYVSMMNHIQSSCHHPMVYRCAGCESQFSDLSGLLQHVESSSCTEGISYGTGSIGKLLHHLWEALA